MSLYTLAFGTFASRTFAAKTLAATLGALVLENTVTFITDLTISSIGGLDFIARTVSIQLVPSQSTGGLTPDIITTLVPVQELKGVLPEVTSTLVPEQVITTNIKMGSVQTTLDPNQVIETNIKNGVVTTVLVPVETISTTASVLSNAEQQSIAVDLGLAIVDGGTFGLDIITTLTPVHQAVAYCVPWMTVGTGRYRAEDIFASEYDLDQIDITENYIPYTFAADNFASDTVGI